jgi:hypothetical protein
MGPVQLGYPSFCFALFQQRINVFLQEAKQSSLLPQRKLRREIRGSPSYLSSLCLCPYMNPSESWIEYETITCCQNKNGPDTFYSPSQTE